MKIALASDVHLEFGHLELNNVDNADVLVLSGDICVASKFGPNYDRFFQDASRLFKNVVYIMGNHQQSIQGDVKVFIQGNVKAEVEGNVDFTVGLTGDIQEFNISTENYFQYEVDLIEVL